MKILFIMDPFSRIHPEKDTTYVLIREALHRKYRAFYCEHLDVFAEKKVFARAQEIKSLRPDSKNKSKSQVVLGDPQARPFSFFDVVLMRTDPPVDFNYFSATYLLDQAIGDTFILNDPRSLKLCNEKFYGLTFPDLFPPTLVSRDRAQIETFVKQQGGKAILKPFYGAGGEGIFRLGLEDSNLGVIIEQATHHGRNMVMVQKFLPEVRAGDKRIILLDGEPVGAVLRVASSKEHRSNIHVGGQVKRTELTRRDLEICETIKSRLMADGLFFVGLDVIGHHLTEINVTSPTGFQEINRLEKRRSDSRLEAIFFDKLRRKLKNRRSNV